MTGTLRTVTVGAEHDGSRLDRCLAASLDGLSRGRVQDLIRAGHVRCAGRTLSDANLRVKSGDVIEIEVPAPEPAEPAPEIMSLAIVYEDDDLIVIDKPAGLVVHPAAGHASGTLVNALIAHCGTSLSGIGGVRRPGIVHRLDKDTTGLLVVAKNDAAHQGLAGQFASHGADGRLVRRYRAFAWGEMPRAAGSVDAPLARSIANRTRIAVTAGGRRAVTHWTVRAVYGQGRDAVSELQLELETGRTHQIRVHLAHVGHPLLGDPTYGAGFAASARNLAPPARDALVALGRQALHAEVLGFEHPRTHERLTFESSLPADLASLAEALRSG